MNMTGGISVDRNMKIKLNPDKDFVAMLKGRIAANNGYCPCRVEKIEDNKCPCLAFRATKACCCGLYVQVPADD